MMIDKSSTDDITCKQEKEDEETFIANIALFFNLANETLVVVGGRALVLNLLLIFIDLCSAEKIVFLKPA